MSATGRPPITPAGSRSPTRGRRDLGEGDAGRFLSETWFVGARTQLTCSASFTANGKSER